MPAGGAWSGGETNGGESSSAGAATAAGAPTSAGGQGGAGAAAGEDGGAAGEGGGASAAAGEGGGASAAAGEGGGGPGNSGCILPTPFNTTPSAFPQVLECAAGLVDQAEHPVGVGEPYFKTEDDLRLGTCGQDTCTVAGTEPYGLDLFFLPPPLDGISAAYVHVRGLPNDGMPATLTLRDYCTREVIDTCTLDPGAQLYDECSLTLSASSLSEAGSYFSLDVSIDSCFFIFDTIELMLE